MNRRDLLINRKRAYQRTFALANGQPEGHARVVLADLKRFAGLPDAPLRRDGTGAVDPIASAVLIGRQEVVNRIVAMLHLDDRVLLNLTEEHE